VLVVLNWLKANRKWGLDAHPADIFGVSQIEDCDSGRRDNRCTVRMLQETCLMEEGRRMIGKLKDYLASVRGKALAAWWAEWVTMVVAVSFAAFMVMFSIALALGLAARITIG